MKDLEHLEIEQSDQTAMRAMEERGSSSDLVCYLIQEWDILPRRPHLTALAQYSRVLLVQVPLTIDSPLRKPRKFLRWLTGRDRLRQISQSLFIARPLALVPYGVSFRYPWLRRANEWLMNRSIRSMTRRLGLQVKAAFIFDPAQEFLIGKANEELLCYEIVDQYANYPGVSAVQREQIIREEQVLLQRADIVFVPNSGFLQEKSRSRSHTYVISNTADADLFATTQNPDTLVPDDLENISEPRIGYIGNLNDLVDCDLLNHISANHPDWSFVLLGRVDGTQVFRDSGSFKTLMRRPNVHFLGWRDYALLPKYLKGFSVCMVPWVNNHFTLLHQPNKLFQYLGGGKPVVSTALPQINALNDEIDHMIGVAETYEAFEELIAVALASNEDHDVVQERMRVARIYSAENMARERIRRISEYRA